MWVYLSARAVDTLAENGEHKMDYILAYLFAALIGLAITYAVIRSAVRAAMFDHYKIVRWYEHTGEWRTMPASWKHAPRDFTLAGTDPKKNKPS